MKITSETLANLASMTSNGVTTSTATFLNYRDQNVSQHILEEFEDDDENSTDEEVS